jgi:hypothetical protein
MGDWPGSARAQQPDRAHFLLLIASLLDGVKADEL